MRAAPPYVSRGTRRGGTDEYPTLEMAFHPELLDLLTGWLEQRFVDGD